MIPELGHQGQAALALGPSSSNKQLILRFPLPYKLAEARYPGTADEKLSCELETYVWMQERCPEIPVPHLHGFGFADNHQVSILFDLRCPTLAIVAAVSSQPFSISDFSQYVISPTCLRLLTAYMLLDHIGPGVGEMLSNTWDEHRSEPIRRQTLFRGMARVMLSLTCIPQPRIGSFRFHGDGTIALTNRPLPYALVILENGGAPRTIPTDETYTCTETLCL